MTPHETGPLPDRVRELAQPLVEPLGIELIEVEVTGPGNRPLVRVIVDTADLSAPTGVDVDDIATVSRQLGDRLDEDVLLDAAYTLEVTSTGADRPLTTYRDFARNVGRDVRIQRRTDDAGDAAAPDPDEVAGQLIDVTDDAVTLDADGAELKIPFTDLDHGKVVLPW